MAGLPAAVWFYNRQYAPVGAMVGAMTPALIEQYEAFVFQQRIDLAETDARRTAPHLVDQLLAASHFFVPALSSNARIFQTATLIVSLN